MATYDITQVTVDPSALRPGDIIVCPYSGSVIALNIPAGTFLLECWGARGGSASNVTVIKKGGNGGYSKGNFTADAQTTLYLVSGQVGDDAEQSESSSSFRYAFNGGGKGGHKTSLGVNLTAAGGGGASHIAFRTGELASLSSHQSDVLIVAGGGGGAYCRGVISDNEGGNGGGESGANGEGGGGKGGTQTAAGAGGSFGMGGSTTGSDPRGAGGGGWYGGGYATDNSSAGGGGSGHVSAALEAATTVQESTSTNPDNQKNGYIRITVLSFPALNFVASYGGRNIIMQSVPMDATLSMIYRGVSHAITVAAGTKTLPTAGKYCDSDIIFRCVKGSQTLWEKTLQCSAARRSDALVTMATDVTIKLSQPIAFTPNKALYRGNVMDEPGYSLSDFIPIPQGCTNITIEAGGHKNTHDVVTEFDANKGYLSYWGSSTNPRTFTFDYPDDIAYIRAVLYTSAIDDCYIYDNTHGQYIWKGANV